MTPHKALRIISLSAFFQCIAVVIKPDFYVYELFHNLTHYDLIVEHLKTFIYLCVICGINIAILIFYASFLDYIGAKKMLKGVSLGFGIMALTLFLYLFTTPLRPPYFILFMMLIFSIFAFVISNKKQPDFN